MIYDVMHDGGVVVQNDWSHNITTIITRDVMGKRVRQLTIEIDRLGQATVEMTWVHFNIALFKELIQSIGLTPK